MKQMPAKFNARACSYAIPKKRLFTKSSIVMPLAVTINLPYFYLRVELMIYLRHPATKLYHINIASLKKLERKTTLLYIQNT